MPKMKTNKSIAKRFKATASGKLKRRKSNLRHNLEKRAHDRKKLAGKSTLVDRSDMKRIMKALPYA